MLVILDGGKQEANTLNCPGTDEVLLRVVGRHHRDECFESGHEVIVVFLEASNGTDADEGIQNSVHHQEVALLQSPGEDVADGIEHPVEMWQHSIYSFLVVLQFVTVVLDALYGIHLDLRQRVLQSPLNQASDLLTILHLNVRTELLA